MNSSEITCEILDLLKKRVDVLRQEFPKGCFIEIPASSSVLTDRECEVLYICDSRELNRVDAQVRDKSDRILYINILGCKKNKTICRL